MNTIILQCNWCREASDDAIATRCSLTLEVDIGLRAIQGACVEYKCVADGSDDATWKIVEVDNE